MKMSYSYPGMKLAMLQIHSSKVMKVFNTKQIKSGISYWNKYVSLRATVSSYKGDAVELNIRYFSKLMVIQLSGIFDH